MQNGKPKIISVGWATSRRRRGKKRRRRRRRLVCRRGKEEEQRRMEDTWQTRKNFFQHFLRLFTSNLTSISRWVKETKIWVCDLHLRMYASFLPIKLKQQGINGNSRVLAVALMTRHLPSPLLWPDPDRTTRELTDPCDWIIKILFSLLLITTAMKWWWFFFSFGFSFVCEEPGGRGLGGFRAERIEAGWNEPNAHGMVCHGQTCVLVTLSSLFLFSRPCTTRTWSLRLAYPCHG